MSAIPTAAREAVRRRQDGQCARCGAAYTEVHHRRRRREGGHEVGNLVGLCTTDHRWAHAHPTQARADGYIVSAHDADPATVPIRTFMGWVLFDNDGDIAWNPNLTNERITQ